MEHRSYSHDSLYNLEQQAYPYPGGSSMQVLDASRSQHGVWPMQLGVWCPVYAAPQVPSPSSRSDGASMHNGRQSPSVVLYAPYAIIAPGAYADMISGYSQHSLSNARPEAVEEVMRKRPTFHHRNSYSPSQPFSPYQQHRGWWRSKNRSSSAKERVPSVSISSVDASDLATESTPRDGSKVPSLCGDDSKITNEEERQRRDPGDASTSGSSGDADASGWGSLTVGILQAIISRSGEGKQLRLVCRHWMAVADNHLETLTPSLMWTQVIIRRFPNLRTLHLTGRCKARNRDLALLSKCQLQNLTLTDDHDHPFVSNSGLKEVAKMSTLTSLSLINCLRVTNTGIQSLSKLVNLSSLSLRGCRNLTSVGLEALKQNQALTSLNLYGCIRLTNNGLLALQNLRLVSLQLGNTKVRDEGLAYLAHITTLQELHFETESLTDAGITQLSSLTRLETLALRDCAAVSSDSLRQLVPGLPNLISLDLCKNFTMVSTLSEASCCGQACSYALYAPLRTMPSCHAAWISLATSLPSTLEALQSPRMASSSSHASPPSRSSPSPPPRTTSGPSTSVLSLTSPSSQASASTTLTCAT
jgi:hypothetical protein